MIEGGLWFVIACVVCATGVDGLVAEMICILSLQILAPDSSFAVLWAGIA